MHIMDIKNINMENKIITKEEIEKYIILEFDKELNKILQYKYNNFIYNMYNKYDQSEKELDLIIKKIILSSWFIRDKKLHPQICELFRYDENHASTNVFKHMKANLYEYEFFIEDWYDEQIKKLDKSMDVWKNK